VKPTHDDVLKMNFIRMLALVSVVGLRLVAADDVQARERYVELVARLAQAPPDDIRFDGELEQALMQRINAERRAKGLAALSVNRRYADAARAHAADLMLRNAMEHRAATGQDFESRMRALNPGVMFLQRLGENAARVRRTKLSDEEKLADIVLQWKKSSSHRKQMMSRDYVSVATGIAVRGGVVYAVQIFAGPEVKSSVTTTAPQQNDVY
jgi:uncharacterized protein YkwD